MDGEEANRGYCGGLGAAAVASIKSRPFSNFYELVLGSLTVLSAVGNGLGEAEAYRYGLPWLPAQADRMGLGFARQCEAPSD